MAVFTNRHIGAVGDDREKLLEAVGFDSLDALTAAAVPGAYLRVLDAGPVRAGDQIEVIHRPAHDITVGLVFRAMTKEPELLPRLVGIAALPDEIRQIARARV